MKNLTPEEAKELFRNHLFKMVIQQLADKLASVKNIQNLDTSLSTEEFGLEARAASIAVSMVEDWFRNILGEIDFEKYKNKIDETDIFWMLNNELKNDD